MPEEPLTSRGEEPNLFELIKLEKEKLKNTSIAQDIDGVVAFISLVKEADANFTGQSIVKTIDASKPDYKSRNEPLYNGIKQIQLIYNSGGTLCIRTQNTEPVRLGDVFIADGTRAQLNVKGDYINFINVEGIYGKALGVKLYATKIILNRVTGDIEAVLKSGISKTANLKKDIIK